MATCVSSGREENTLSQVHQSIFKFTRTQQIQAIQVLLLQDYESNSHYFDFKYRKNNQKILIQCSASAFLQHMVQNIVGTLIDVGKGVLSPESISLILDSKDRTKSSKTVSSSGLYLVAKIIQVNFNYLIQSLR